MKNPASIDIEKYYFQKPVFITGADGFMGSHLTEKLVHCNAIVHVFVRATSSGELNNIKHLKNKITIHRGDLTDKHVVKESLLKFKKLPPGIIFHLGAQAHVGESWERPYETVNSNIMGTLNLLQSIIDINLSVQKFDTAGTSEEYGNIRDEVRDQHDFDDRGDLILHERSPLNPKSIYATAKVAADFLTMNYYDAYGIPGVVTRMFNNYGPRQNPRYVTGTVITQAITRSNIELGNTETMRDFCFCEDGVRGHMTVAAFGKPGNVYCYGQGKNISIQDWAELIIHIGQKEGYWGHDRHITYNTNRYRPGKSDVKALRVAHEKISNETGWSPIFNWEEGIKKTIKWYIQNQDKWFGRVDWS